MSEMLEMERKIREAGLHNPIIARWLSVQKQNQLSWSETLEYITMSLLEQNGILYGELLYMKRNCCRPGS
jgi:hypothetical protein